MMYGAVENYLLICSTDKATIHSGGLLHAIKMLE